MQEMQEIQKMQPLPAKTRKTTSALLSVNDPRCLTFGKGSFVKSPTRVTMAVGGVNEATTALNPLAFGARMSYCLD